MKLPRSGRLMRLVWLWVFSRIRRTSAKNGPPPIPGHRIWMTIADGRCIGSGKKRWPGHSTGLIRLSPQRLGPTLLISIYIREQHVSEAAGLPIQADEATNLPRRQRKRAAVNRNRFLASESIDDLIVGCRQVLV